MRKRILILNSFPKSEICTISPLKLKNTITCVYPEPNNVLHCLCVCMIEIITIIIKDINFSFFF